MGFRLRQNISSLLKIRPGEGWMAVRLTGLMFFSSAGGAIGSPGVEALFFDRFGVQFLPHMYIALGLATLITSLAMTAALGKLDRKRFYSGLPLVMSLTLAGERFLLVFDQRWFFPVLWLSMNIFWVLQSLFAWGVASLICDMRQSKRLFPLFGAGSILGLAVGGLITRPLVGWIGTENLLLAWISGLALAFLLTRSLVRRVEKRPGPRFKSRPTMLEEIQTGIFYSLRSPLLRWMSMAAVLFAVLWYSVVFPFSKAASANFPNDQALAGFLGVFQGLAMAAAILVSLLAAGRIYARLGFITAILIFPVLYSLGFFALAVFSIFPILAAFRFSQIVWSEGVSEEANQAMFNVVPQLEREQSRAFVRGIANQIGVSLAGVLLLIGQQPFFQSFNLYYLDAAAAACAVFLVWKARKAYRQAILSALRAGQPQIFFSEEQPFGGFKRDADALSIVIAGIGSPDPTIRRVSAEILGEISPVEGIEAAIFSLEDGDPFVRAALLRAIGRSGASKALPEVTARLEDPVPEVRVEAIEALQRLNGYSRQLALQLQAGLQDTHPVVRARAAAALLRQGQHAPAELVLHNMAKSKDAESRIEALKALADWASPQAYQLAALALEDPFPAVRREAATALARIDPQQCLEPLIHILGDEDISVKEAAARTLTQLGPPALDPLVAALSNPHLEAGALLALRNMPVHSVSKELRAYALERVNQALHYHSLWLDSITQKRAPEVVNFVSESLREKSLQAAEHALIGIGLLGDPESVGLALENLKTSSTEQVAAALETLESFGAHEVVGPLLRLWESPVNHPPVPLGHWLESVLADADPWLRACAMLAAKKTGEISQEALENLSETDPDPFVRETACSLLEEDQEMKTLTTISLMERIFLLRRVSLFANLKSPDLKAISQVTGEHIFAPGEMIAEQGEPGDEMFILISGEVGVKMSQGKGKEEKEIARRKPGDVVGEMALISQEPRMASLVAVGEVRALCIEQDKFIEILRLRPETSLAVMRILCQRLRESSLLE